MKPKKINDSRTTMTEMVMPNDTNPIGHLMGGNLMRWMDIVGGICAGKHAESYVVTASVDNVSFHKPIMNGDVITLEARVTRAFTTSLEVYVEVFAANIKGGNSRKCNHAFFTFVAIDEQTHTPVPVPQVIPLTQEEENLYEGASRRREVRLVLGGKMKAKDAKDIKAYFAEI
jgi:acyl-CoA hydrolase